MRLVIIILFFSIYAHAETGSIALRSLNALGEAATGRGDQCKAISRNESCAHLDSGIAQAEKGLVSTCEAQLAGQECTYFFKKFPEYAFEKMRCSPADVCERSLESTMLIGCEDYGISVSNSVRDVAITEKHCLADRLRYLGQALRTAFLFVAPATMLS